MSFTNHLMSLTRTRKRLVQMGADLVLIVIAFVLAMAIRVESFAFLQYPQSLAVLLGVVPVTLAVFAALDLYRSVVRYITGQILRTVALGAAASGVMMAITSMAFPLPVPRSVPLIHAMLLFFLVSGLRFLVRALFMRPAGRVSTSVVVYGAGDAGRQLVNALNQGREYHPVAFVDDDKSLQGSMIGALRVHDPAHLPDLIRNARVRTILLAIPSATRGRRRELVEVLRPLGVEIKTIPGIADIVSGKARFNDLRAVKPEDVLGRDPVEPDPALMRRHIAGKVVMVTGAGGSIGSELCRQILLLEPAALVMLDVSEFNLYAIDSELRESMERRGLSFRLVPLLGSVQNPGRMKAILEGFEVQTIYHAAAYKHVPLVEENIVEGVRNNVFGTQTIARTAAEAGVANFILISTDKAVRPTNVMGASKRMAELVCQALARESRRTVFSMVRFGNVLGSSGSVIPRFASQIEKGGPVTVTHRDINRYFMTIPEAAQLVIQAGAMAKGGDVFVLDMGEPVRILDLAQTMVRLNGLVPYVIEKDEAPDPSRGDIAVQITGLRKGEKLYEELLIGENPTGTAHPRIMTASEASLDPTSLQQMLDRLMAACLRFDMPEIRAILLEAPLAYRPTSDSISDLIWDAGQRRAERLATSNLHVLRPAKDSRNG